MPREITQLLQAASRGDRTASDEILPLVYASLRRLAHSRMARESRAQTLQPTALVHEAYLRLVGSGSTEWRNRAHFFGAAAEAMRRILIERARRVRTVKHGGHLERVDYDESALLALERHDRMLELDDALARFEREHPRKAQVVKLRYFAGFDIEETAAALDISPTTVKLDWSYARAWLSRDMASRTGAIP